MEILPLLLPCLRLDSSKKNVISPLKIRSKKKIFIHPVLLNYSALGSPDEGKSGKAFRTHAIYKLLLIFFCNGSIQNNFLSLSKISDSFLFDILWVHYYLWISNFVGVDGQ